MTPRRLSDFFPLAVQSLFHPRIALQRVLEIPASRNDLVRAGLLIIVLNLLVSAAFSIFGPSSTDPSQQPISLSTSFVMLGLTLFGGAFLLHKIGAAFGGTGDFDASLKTVIWLNFVFLLLQFPMPFAAAAGAEIFTMCMFLIVIVAIIHITALVMELHGFTKVLPVLLGILGTQFVFGFILLIVLGMMGGIAPIETVN